MISYIAHLNSCLLNTERSVAEDAKTKGNTGSRQHFFHRGVSQMETGSGLVRVENSRQDDADEK